MGGEGIVLKDRASTYRPSERSPAWLKLKPKLTLDVIVTGGSGERVAWGTWGEAVDLEMEYMHPRTAQRTAIRQAVRIARQQPFGLRWARVHRWCAGESCRLDYFGIRCS
jgi:hypothetical protein